jgi:hypothetical protein
MLQLTQGTGKLTLLRVQDVDQGFGPPNDRIDAEVIVAIDTSPDSAFGFRLLPDGNRPVREGMLSLLRDAYAANSSITLEYLIDQGKKNGILKRAFLKR